MEEWSGGGGGGGGGGEEDSNETRLPRKKVAARSRREGGRPCLMHVSRGLKEHVHLYTSRGTF